MVTIVFLSRYDANLCSVCWSLGVNWKPILLRCLSSNLTIHLVDTNCCGVKNGDLSSEWRRAAQGVFMFTPQHRSLSLNFMV